MRNREVAELLTKMGTLLEVKGELVFKVKAYYRAAANISALGEDIVKIKEENRLSEIAGVGKTLQEKITEFLDTGRLKAYETLAKEIPATVLDIVHIPSVGPKKAKLFYDELNVRNLQDLQKAIDNGKLLGLPGIKEKTIENIVQGLAIVRKGQERMNLGRATQVAEAFLEKLKSLREVKKISAAGSLRRGCETVRDIDILIVSPAAQKVMNTFVSLPQVKSVNAHGETKSSVLTENNTQVDLRVVDEKSFGAALLYFTGSKNFNIKLRQTAIKKAMKVNEYGVFSTKGKKEKLLASETEEECFKILELPYLPPELREDIGEKECFSLKKTPALIEEKDIKGELHVHSTYSDGRNTIEEMAGAAQKRGYHYLAISDHSPKLRVAGGVLPADLKRKKKEIEAVNKRMKNFRVLFGTEVEIDIEGNLDYNEKILSDFDVVIGAIHSGFEQSEASQTKRLLKAIKNKHVNIIAHPTGVHLGKREPYALNFHDICKAAVDHNVFLEINAFPVRLDLNSQNIYYARSQGVTFVVNTDAHNVEHLNHMHLGISLARRGWLTKKDVLNTTNLSDLMKAMRK